MGVNGQDALGCSALCISLCCNKYSLVDMLLAKNQQTKFNLIGAVNKCFLDKTG